MRKVRYTEPRTISKRDHGSHDPAKYIAQTCEGYMLEIEPEPVILHKDPRGMWTIVDPVTGWRVDSVRVGYKSRKEAAAHAREVSEKLHVFKTAKASREHYEALARVTETLAHELALIENARAE